MLAYYFIGSSQQFKMLKAVFVFGFFLALGISGLNGAEECPRSTPDLDLEAMKLMPCAEALYDEDTSVSFSCCTPVQKLCRNPRCLCAVVLSDTFKSAGVRPEIAVTIPKRCYLADRPFGYKCGDYTFP